MTDFLKSRSDHSGADQARGGGFFKFVQSAGWCAGFGLSPTNRLPAFYQLVLTAACYILGLAFLEMPKDATANNNDSRSSDGGHGYYGAEGNGGDDDSGGYGYGGGYGGGGGGGGGYGEEEDGSGEVYYRQEDGASPLVSGQ